MADCKGDLVNVAAEKLLKQRVISDQAAFSILAYILAKPTCGRDIDVGGQPSITIVTVQLKPPVSAHLPRLLQP
jgi:hypothetical protein